MASQSLGSCKLCLVPYTSPSHKDDHLKGSKHKMKVVSQTNLLKTSLPVIPQPNTISIPVENNFSSNLPSNNRFQSTQNISTPFLQPQETPLLVDEVCAPPPQSIATPVSDNNVVAGPSTSVPISLQGLENLSLDIQPRTCSTPAIVHAGNNNDHVNNNVSNESAVVNPSSSEQSTAESITPSSHYNNYIEHFEVRGIYLASFCTLCNKKIDNKLQIDSHLKSREHTKNVSLQPASFVDLPPIVSECDDIYEEVFCLTNSMPRGYQVELFEKSHCSNSIIFLPTGTGKTLISIMVISHMLKLNPRRSVLFIVDKVLLALQQSYYIKKELNTQKYLRFDPLNIENVIERDLKVICVYGGCAVPRERVLSKHDIIVSTAVYCDHQLKNNVLRWKDFSLVVIDEVHHADKEHPFRKVLREEHLNLDGIRPQLLGLTASPAGKDTIERTVDMLKALENNLDNSKIHIVKEELKELKKYKSSAILKIETVPFSHSDLEKMNNFKEYLLGCLQVLVNYSDLHRSELKDNYSLIDGNCLNEIENRLKYVNVTGEEGELLLNHTKSIVSIIIDALAGSICCVVEKLKILSNDSEPTSFYIASRLGLRCDLITSIVNKIISDSGSYISDQLTYLIRNIEDHLSCNNDDLSGIILIMVKRRSAAIELCKLMKAVPFIKNKNLSVISVVGHGDGGEYGMSVNLQRKIFQEIKEGQHQIIISTSVAEEGIDLPKCSLVITMNPPTSVITLVQMRGRVRKNNSTFLVVCQDPKETENLKNVLSHEKIMEQATEQVVNNYER
ncbi:dicer-like protein 1 [Argonauta hians]